MKPKEKKMIAILVVITLIVVGIFIVTRNKGKQENNKVGEGDKTVVENDTTNVETKDAEEFVEILENGTKLNTSSKLGETKKVNGLEFGNIQLTNKNGSTQLIADVKNNTGAATEVTFIDITLLDKDGNELVTVGGIISALEKGGQTQFSTNMTLDYSNAYDFTVKVKK